MRSSLPWARAEADLQVIDIADVRCFDDPQEEVDEIEQLKEQQRELRENLLKKRSPSGNLMQEPGSLN